MLWLALALMLAGVALAARETLARHPRTTANDNATPELDARYIGRMRIAACLLLAAFAVLIAHVFVGDAGDGANSLTSVLE